MFIFIYINTQRQCVCVHMHKYNLQHIYYIRIGTCINMLTFKCHGTKYIGTKKNINCLLLFGNCLTFLSETVSCDLLFKCRTIPLTDLEKHQTGFYRIQQGHPSYMGYSVLLWATSFSVKLFNYRSNGIQWRAFQNPFASSLIGCFCLFPNYVL